MHGLLRTLVMKTIIIIITHTHIYATQVCTYWHCVPDALLNAFNILLYSFLTVLRGRCYYLKAQAQEPDCLGSNPKCRL